MKKEQLLSQVASEAQRTLDPFGSSKEVQRARAMGMYNLARQMADPSLETVKQITLGFNNLSHDQLENIHFDLDCMYYDPSYFFKDRGIQVTVDEELRRGADSSRDIFYKMYDRFYHDTGKSFYDIDPDEAALSIFENIQFAKKQQDIESLTVAVRNEPDLKTRLEKATLLRENLMGMITSPDLRFIQYKDAFDPSWERLAPSPKYSITLQKKDGTNTKCDFAIEDGVAMANAAITRFEMEERIEELPTLDKERLEVLRLEYGAKAGNLILLSEMIEAINNVRTDNLTIAVPDFQAIPVTLFRKWKEGQAIDGELKPYFKAIHDFKDELGRTIAEPRYLVRSSAVFSEDGEITGAGIYDSIEVQEDSFENFKQAVVAVFESTDSPQAKAYRQENNIEKEEMGIVVQNHIAPQTLTGGINKGYINSHLLGVPSLMEIVTPTSRNFIRRDELDFFLGLNTFNHHSILNNLHHFNPDGYKINKHLPIEIAQVTSVLERIWGDSIQVEFVQGNYDINIVQIRQLPYSKGSSESEVKFPPEEPLFSGASVGVGDMSLPLLESKKTNYNKTGVAFFAVNNEWSVGRNELLFPKKGAVVITDFDEGDQNGHIQTLAAERGIICVFPDRGKNNGRPFDYEHLSNYQAFRVVSNGIEGRLYPAEEKDLEVDEENN